NCSPVSKLTARLLRSLGSRISVGQVMLRLKGACSEASSLSRARNGIFRCDDEALKASSRTQENAMDLGFRPAPSPLVDPFGRVISYLRVSVTDRCDFRCVYCMAENMTFLPKRDLLTLEELDRLCSAFIARGVKKLRLTGGEPLVRRGIMTLFASLSRHLASGALDELTLTTNGSQLAKYAGELAARGMDLTLIEVMPLGEIGEGRLDQYLPLSIVRARLSDRYTLEDIDHRTGGPARYVRVKETGGRLGFITPLTHNFCESCNRVRVTCTGTLYMCLGQEDAADLRKPLRASEANDLLYAAIDEAIGRKPKGHDFIIDRRHRRPAIARHMSVTGG